MESSVQRTTLQTRKQKGEAVTSLTQQVGGWIKIHTQAWTPRLWEDIQFRGSECGVRVLLLGLCSQFCQLVAGRLWARVP